VLSKFFTRRAIGLHFALIFWVALCASASYWQVGRALQGNSLSYLYSFEWPVFGVAGVLAWWAMLHTEKVTEEQEAERKVYEDQMRAQALAARIVSEEEDPTLAAYNDHLAELSRLPKKRLWGH
jgi:DNA-binding transcriptional regulator of glucitol operon